MSKKRNRLTLACTGLLLGACAGSGSFDTIEVNTEEKLPEKKKIERVAEPRQSTEEQETFKKPGLGYVMKNVRRNRGRYNAQGEELSDGSGKPTEAQPHAPLDPNTLEEITAAEFTAPKADVLAADPDTEGKRVYDPLKRQTFPEKGYISERDKAKKYHYIRFGHVSVDYPREIFETYNNDNGKRIKYISGSNSYTFYHGLHTSPALPNQNSVQYTGQWNFISDAKMGRVPRAGLNYDNIKGNGYDNVKGNGDNASASDQTFNATADWQSNFTVNFADKKLTGNLGYKLAGRNTAVNLYQIEADINANRFTGKAKSVLGDDASEADKSLFSQNSDLLEGGFYGPKGEELAGKFLTNDNSLFGVFGAKRDSSNDDSEANRNNFNALFDAAHLSAATRTEETEYQEDEEFEGEYSDNPEPRERLGKVEVKPLANFGYAMKLRFGGQTFDLNPAAWDKDGTATKTAEDGSISINFCCSNLSYLRFGTYRLPAGADGGPLRGVFLQGERTPLGEVPQTGKAQYAGTWAGFIQMADPVKNVYSHNEYFQNANMSGVSNGGLANRAEFDVDFGAKSLTGKLLSPTTLTVFNINAAIKGNGFTGTASTPANGGFPLDAGNSRSFTANISGAEVKGGFYGPNARELGGTLHYNSAQDGVHGPGLRAGAVFGASRQD